MVVGAVSVVAGVIVAAQLGGVIRRNAPVVVHAAEVAQVVLIPARAQRLGRRVAQVAPTTEVVQRELPARAPARRRDRDRRLQAARKRQRQVQTAAQLLRGTHPARNNGRQPHKIGNRSGNSRQKTVP